jgi:hypothetical protein
MHITRPLVQQGILAGLSLLLGFVVFVLMDRNTVISGSQMKRREAAVRAAAASPEVK